jgi:hypothetical protein
MLHAKASFRLYGGGNAAGHFDTSACFACPEASQDDGEREFNFMRGSVARLQSATIGERKVVPSA